MTTHVLMTVPSAVHGHLSHEVVSAQSFYRDMLGGRQTWPTERDSPGESLWFAIGPTLLEVIPTRAGRLEMLVLAVDSPASIAERCWDSGYTVRLPADGEPGEVIVIDPFGRPISLIPRLSECSLGAEAEGEEDATENWE